MSLANAQNTTPSSPVGQASRIQTRTTPIDVRRRGIFGRIFSSIPLRRNLTRSHPTHDTTNAPANNDPTLDEIRQPPNVVLDQILHAIEQQTRVQDQGLNRLTEAIIQASSYPSDDDDDPNSPAAPGSTEEADVDGPNDDAQFSDTSYGRPAPPTLRASTREPPATSGAEPSSTAGAPGRASASQAGPSNHTAQSSLNSGGGGSHAPAPLLGCTAQSSGALDDPRSPHLSRGYTAGGNVNPRLESKRRKRRTFIGYSASLPKDGAFHGNRLSVYVGTKDELRKLFRDEDIRPFWDGLGLLLPFCEGYAHELTQLHIYIFQPCLNEDLTYKQDMLVPVLDALRPRLPNFLSVTISFSCGDQVSQDLGSLTQTIRAAFFALRHLRLEGFAKLPRLFLFPVEDLRVLEILSQTAVAEVDMIQLMVWCKQLDFFQVHSFGNPASERTYFAPDPNPSVAYPHVMHFVHDHLSDLFIQNIPNDRIVHLTVTDTAEYRQKELLFGGNTFWSLKCDDSN